MRIGQIRPVRVVCMSYRGTLQVDALKLVASKLQSSLAYGGELPEDGLVAFGDGGDDLLMALARQIVVGEQDEAETVVEVLARVSHAACEAEEWKPMETEPETVEVNGNDHRDDDATEPRQAPFSWAEFITSEPARPNRRRRKPKSPSMSMFECTLTPEEGREAESVSAG